MMILNTQHPPMLIIYVYNYVLAVKRSAGVAPEVTLRNPLHKDEETCNPRIQTGFETQGRHHQKFKTGVPVAPQKALMSSKKLK